MKPFIWRRTTEIFAYVDLFLSGLRGLGSVVFGGWVGYESIRIFSELKDTLPPDDGLPGFILLIWTIGGFMNIFAVHQLMAAVRLVKGTKSDLFYVTALNLSSSWRKGNASFIMSIVLDVLLIRYFRIDVLFILLPCIQICFRLAINLVVRMFRKELGAIDDCEQLKI